jgi:hypothetical protein
MWEPVSSPATSQPKVACRRQPPTLEAGVAVQRIPPTFGRNRPARRAN